MSHAQEPLRLPSPPPAPEMQLGLNTTASSQEQQEEQTVNEANAKRRIRKGTKAEDIAAGPPLVPLNELDSAFQLQEHLAALHYHLTDHNTVAITRTTAAQLAQPPLGIDKSLWLYELCRFLIAQCNSLIVGFLFDSPPCSSATCPEMRASEWQFLCAVHDQPKSCCAIDYCCHTLDWAANVVTNPKLFPSRILMASEGHERNAVLKNLVNVFRRLHRIFAHAWYQHRGVFWSVEAQTGLYAFFKTVCDLYDLLPAENYKLPPEAEGLEPEPSSKDEKRLTVTAIAKPPLHHNDNFENDEDRNSMIARRSNTARHSSRPSTGSAVTTVPEEGEDENTGSNEKSRGMNTVTPDIAEEESEVEVPVIVEGGMMEASTSTPMDTEAAGPSEHPIDPEETQKEPTTDNPESAQEKSEDTQEAPDDTSQHITEEIQPALDDDNDKETVNLGEETADEASTSTVVEKSEDEDPITTAGTSGDVAESSPDKGKEKMVAE